MSGLRTRIRVLVGIATVVLLGGCVSAPTPAAVPSTSTIALPAGSTMSCSLADLALNSETLVTLTRESDAESKGLRYWVGDRTDDEIAGLTAYTHAVASARAQVDVERTVGPNAGLYRLDGESIVAIFAVGLEDEAKRVGSTFRALGFPVNTESGTGFIIHAVLSDSMDSLSSGRCTEAFNERIALVTERAATGGFAETIRRFVTDTATDASLGSIVGEVDNPVPPPEDSAVSVKRR
jgi:hypothetical protein